MRRREGEGRKFVEAPEVGCPRTSSSSFGVDGSFCLFLTSQETILGADENVLERKIIFCTESED